MPRVTTRIAFLLVWTGCSSEIEQTCDDLCTELVGSCDVAAFPNIDSCIEGCLYNAEELGADVTGEFGCVQAAACDIPTIIECEHQYGVD
jgi:hypothetical protein